MQKLAKSMHRVLVVEDQDLMRLALMGELKESLHDCMTFGAESLELALQLLDGEDFDLVIIDPGLPGFDPTSYTDRLTVVEKLIEASPSAIHLIVTGSDSRKEAEACRRLGAACYVGKTGLPQGMLASILEDISSSGFAVRLSLMEMHRPEIHYSGLAQREQQIVDMMARRERGMTRQQIYCQMAARLDIDPGTVEKYFKQARAKLLKQGCLPKGF